MQYRKEPKCWYKWKLFRWKKTAGWRMRQTGFLCDDKNYWWEVEIAKAKNIMKFPFSDHKGGCWNFKRPCSFFFSGRKEILKKTKFVLQTRIKIWPSLKIDKAPTMERRCFLIYVTFKKNQLKTRAKLWQIDLSPFFKQWPEEKATVLL